MPSLRPNSEFELKVTDMHTAGEPVRIVTGGYPALKGDTILAKRRFAQAELDHIRTRLMLEPRGHPEMYGVIPTEPVSDDAALGVLFTHNSGYSTMCGHATVAIGRWAIDSGIVTATEPKTEFTVDCPCGPVRVSAVIKNGCVGEVSFDSVPSFVDTRSVNVKTSGGSQITADIAYGGAYYAIVSAKSLGLSLLDEPISSLIDVGIRALGAVRAVHKPVHPTEPDLGFLYGVIITEHERVFKDRPNCHLCVFGDGQLDRSPTGSGVSARLALASQRGEIANRDRCQFFGASGVGFDGEIAEEIEWNGAPAVTARVTGYAHYTGKSEFVFEEDDSLRDGFYLGAGAKVPWDK